MQEHIVGYGTLLYRASLGDSIGHEEAAVRDQRPVIVRGFRRLFNLRPDHYGTSAVLSDAQNENAALNVEPAGAHDFNGLLFAVDSSELEELDRREAYYERQSAEAWDFVTGKPVGPCSLYTSRLDAPWIVRDPALLLPLWRDIEWSRMGAYAISEEFGRHFDRTTFLADGTTLVADHYRHLLDGTGASPWSRKLCR